MTRSKRRPPAVAAEPLTDNTDMAAVARKSEALTAIGSLSAEASEMYGDGQPYDRHRVIAEARVFATHSAVAMFELGKRLLMIKANEPKGEFMEIVEDRLGIPYRTAARFMAVSLKLSSIPSHKLPALAGLGKTKMFYLLDEPVEDIEALVDGGTIADMKLDKFLSMTSREMKDALAEAAKKAAAQAEVIGEQNKTISELRAAEKRRRTGSDNEREKAQLDDIRADALTVEMGIRQFISTAGSVIESPATEAAAAAAHHAVAFVAQVLAMLINERGIDVDFTEMVTPHWLIGVTKATDKSNEQ